MKIPSHQQGEAGRRFRDQAVTEGLSVGPSSLYSAKAAYTLARSLWWLIRRRRTRSSEGLRILFYHRVSDERDELAVKPSRFRDQMSFLASEGYDVVDVGEAARLIREGSIPPRTIGLSFDDGYLDIAEHALPVLEELGFRATVFVATDVIDGGATFSWYRTQPALLSWEQISLLDREQTFRFEAHSRTHPNLLALDDEAARDEIAGCRPALAAHLSRPVTVFSYPAGLFGARERRLVAEAGYAAAVSCEPGANYPGTDLFALRRRQIDARDSLLDFRAKVGGGHDSPPPLRGAYRRRYGRGTGRPRASSS